MNYLLQYLIEKSYTDSEAQEALDHYDAERTGRSYEDVKLINALIRTGNVRMATEYLK